MNSIRFRIAGLLVVSVLILNMLAVALILAIIEPRLTAATMTPVANQLALLAEAAERDPASIALLGAVVEDQPLDGPEDDLAAGMLRDILAERGIERDLRVFFRPGVVGATALVGLQGGRWLSVVIPDLSPQSSGFDALLIWLIVLTTGTGIVSFYAAWRVTVPLQLLHDTMLTFGTDGVPAPLPEAGPIEVKQTAMAINRLSARLRKSIASRMRVVAAAGHDLRTPLTRLRLRAEFIRDEAEREKWLADLAELEGIANSAIRLVREETGGEEPATFRLDDHLRVIVRDLRSAGHSVSLDIRSPVTVRAGPIALRRALSNLIVNAATHGGGAEVSLTLQDGTAAVDIVDNGPGIPEALLEQVFEPFFSADPARRRTVPGAGLGLSIAQSILERSGGTVSIQNRPNGGLRQHVELKAIVAEAPLN
ncbi:ATP-binding protein [Pararhodobacter aggregans]|uniref:histidine kinase n=1 Tax=Pararhodobacter aggregans TaxID=404875 RepID=A0A2T7UV31_9RHOB|nr:ATP-binding protein [Pararhodobacter aggregans]PTX04094.1 signal transduction histidine kinase [Pararhodobacter aggregans]PVE48441.1 two-component sensor histidine kinase [Pararhodobacter aggregans]